MEGLVSIIVPVYGAEKYLARCVDSIISQTYQNWELLLVDDGSPDNSGMICDNYAASDKRIRVFHKNNGGVSSARQYGLDNATGEYVIHADPDDWVEPDMIDILYKTAKDEKSDMVICDIMLDGKSSFIKKQKPRELTSLCIVHSFFDGTMHASCCNKLILRSLFDKYNIKFPLQLSLYEDLYVNSMLLMQQLKISYVPQAFYHYCVCVNLDSITSKTYTDASYEYDLFVYDFFSSKFKDTDVLPKVKIALVSNMVRSAFHTSSYSTFEFMNKFYKYRNIFIKCPYLSWFEKFKYYISTMGFYGVFQLRRCIIRKYRELLKCFM